MDFGTKVCNLEVGCLLSYFVGQVKRKGQQWDASPKKEENLSPKNPYLSLSFKKAFPRKVLGESSTPKSTTQIIPKKFLRYQLHDYVYIHT